MASPVPIKPCTASEDEELLRALSRMLPQPLQLRRSPQLLRLLLLLLKLLLQLLLLLRVLPLLFLLVSQLLPLVQHPSNLTSCV